MRTAYSRNWGPNVCSMKIIVSNAETYISLKMREKRQRTPCRLMRNASWIFSPYVPHSTIAPGWRLRSSTRKSFDSISVFNVSRNILSFSVSFMRGHPDRSSDLAQAHRAGVGQKHDRDKPPYAVQERVITQGWYSLEWPLDRAQERSNVCFVAKQIKPLARGQRRRNGGKGGQTIQGHEEVIGRGTVDFEVFQGR